MRLLLIAITMLILTFMRMPCYGQDQPEISWKRSPETGRTTELILFHSPHALQLETAKTLSKSNFEFQIYHRFIPEISEGYDLFYGLDGPANIRIGLAYAVTDRFMTTLARSSVDANVDLRGKYRLYEVARNDLSFMLGAQGGIGWNTDVFGRDSWDDENFQYYGQAILNGMYRDKLGIGLVPSYLCNAGYRDEPFENSFSLGVYAQYYVIRRFSVLAEWNAVLDGYSREFDTWSLGFEVQTAGHFFKILVTNSTDLNPSHYLAGADQSFDTENWHLGFNITRLLVF